MIFDNNYSTLVLSVSITAITLLIMFNITNIYQEKMQLNRDFTGLAIDNQEGLENKLNDSQQNLNQTQTSQQELYSTKSYFIYTMLLGMLSFAILGLVVRLLFPKIKNFT